MYLVADDDSDRESNKPERNLYAAVMNRAINDLHRSVDSKDQVLWVDGYRAREWFLEDKSSAITFKDCCSVLELNRDSVLLALRAKGLLEPFKPLNQGKRKHSYKFLGAIRRGRSPYGLFF